MSRENVEIIREWTDAWNRRDVESMLLPFHPDVEWRTSGVFPGLASVYAGHEGFRRFWAEFTGLWDWFAISADELRDCDDRVLYIGAFEAQARGGLRVQRKAVAVWTFRDGLAVRIQNHADVAQALDALGLSE